MLSRAVAPLEVADNIIYRLHHVFNKLSVLEKLIFMLIPPCHIMFSMARWPGNYQLHILFLYKNRQSNTMVCISRVNLL